MTPVMRQSPTAGVTTCRRPLTALRFPALIAARISKARACAAARANASAPIVSARQTWLSWPRSVLRKTPSVAASAVVPLSQLGAMAAEYRNLSAFALTNAENGSQGPRPDFVRANVQKVPVLLSVLFEVVEPMPAGVHQAGHDGTPSAFKIGERKTMARTGRSSEHMARMRSRRRPFTDPRAGLLLRAIEFAFVLSRGEPISTSRLVTSCYPVAHIFGGLKSWHRSNVVRAARQVAEPVGRASTRGRPLVWRPMPRRSG
jgi:hypothetical protein